jgi:hypothetical protein
MTWACNWLPARISSLEGRLEAWHRRRALHLQGTLRFTIGGGCSVRGPGLAKPSENGAPFIKTEALQNNRSQIQRGG